MSYLCKYILTYMFQNDCNETEIFISILSIFYLEFVCVQAFICIKQYKKKVKEYIPDCYTGCQLMNQ